MEMAKWNVGNTDNNIPESVCSKPCPMGQIKNFEVSSELSSQTPNSNTIYYGIKQRTNMSINAPLLQYDINIDLQCSII